jgi:hypothetical protein
VSIEDNGADSNTGGHSSIAKSFRSHVPDATLTNAPTLTAEADGSLTATAARLTWSDGDALGREFNYMVFGDTADATLQQFRPDADTTTTGWTATPLFSKINDESDATVITATAS